MVPLLSSPRPQAWWLGDRLSQDTLSEGVNDRQAREARGLCLRHILLRRESAPQWPRSPEPSAFPNLPDCTAQRTEQLNIHDVNSSHTK